MRVWQKGGVENAIGRIRRWLPRGTDLDEISEVDIQEIAMTIKHHPAQVHRLQIPGRGVPVRAWQGRRNQVCLNRCASRWNPPCPSGREQSIADVVDPERRVGGGGVGIRGFPVRVGRRDEVRGADHALDDVVDIGEVAAVAAVVEDLDRAAREDGVGEFHRRHVGPAPGAVDREEAQARAGQAVEMGVGMRHQLVGALGGGVELERMVDALALLEGHGGVGAVDARGRGVGQMRRLRPAAGLEDVGEAHEVRLDVGARVLDGMAHAGLGGEVDHPVEGRAREGGRDRVHVGEIGAEEASSPRRSPPRSGRARPAGPP